MKLDSIMLGKTEIKRDSRGRFLKGQNFLVLSKEEIQIITEQYEKGKPVFKLAKELRHSALSIKQALEQQGIHIKNQKDYFLGKTYEERYGNKRAVAIKESISKDRKGKTYKEYYGEDRAKEIAKKQKESNIKTWQKPEIREKLCGANNPFFGRHHTGKALTRIHGYGKFITGKTYKELFGEKRAAEIVVLKAAGIAKSYANMSPAKLAEKGRKISRTKKERIRAGILNPRKGITKVSKPELMLKLTIEKNNLGFKHNGNGDIFIHGPEGSFNPDFILENKKLIIEVFGDYWHNLPSSKDKDERRLKTYTDNGYKTLILWEHELQNRSGKKIMDEQKVVNTINEFLNQGGIVT